jgi:hypothetical protein
MIESELRDIALSRDKPLSDEKRSEAMRKCAGIGNVSLRQLCLIYLLHWGEKGNIQKLFKQGGRLTDKEALRRETILEEKLERKAKLEKMGMRFIENPEDDDEEWDEESIPMTIEELEAAEGVESMYDAPASAAYSEWQRRAEIGTVLVPRSGSVKTAQIYSGKTSGLSWWYGTGGNLRPQMPVMSTAQVGRCTGAEKDDICRELLELWHRWQSESATKAEALVAWIAEAIDTAAQLGLAIAGRSGSWVPADAPWQDTKAAGTKRDTEPRLVFREHLPQQIINWFKAVAWQYRFSAGREGARSERVTKVVDQQPPDWYESDDPIVDLPYDERMQLIDWIMSLTGQSLPQDTTARFPVTGSNHLASTAQIGKVITTMCAWVSALDSQRKDGPGGKGTVAKYLRAATLAEAPPRAREAFKEHEKSIILAVSAATGAHVPDFNIRRAYKARKEIMAIIGGLFGQEAANSATLKNVARCGRVPLSGNRELFNVANGTISHDEDFKIAIARKFRVHSECVARRSARELWELLKARGQSAEAIKRPRQMIAWVESMRADKVPCSSYQERELRVMLRDAGISPDDSSVYDIWGKAYEVSEAGPLLSEAEEQERGFEEEYEDARHKAYEQQVLQAAEFFTPNGPSLPTPIHFLLALQ